MSKHTITNKTNKTELQTNASDRQKIMLVLGTAAIFNLSIHIHDVAKAINEKIDISQGIMKAIDKHEHIHSDILIDRRNTAQYDSEEKSTTNRDRDNWEIYENGLAIA